MGKWLSQWQKGFSLGDEFYSKVFEHKVLWLASLVVLLFDLGQINLVLYGLKYKVPFFMLGLITFPIIYYFVTFVLFFFAEGIYYGKRLSWLACAKKSLVMFRFPAVWFFVALRFMGISLWIFTAISIPAIITCKESIKDAFFMFFSLLKRFFFLIMGFAIYLMLIAIVFSVFIWLLGMLLVAIRIKGVEMIGQIITYVVYGIILSFFNAMRVFLQVHVYKEM